MSKDKQIEDMAKCCTYYHKGECCADTSDICDCNLMCEMFGVFANLKMAGYRKASEVAREIFEEADKIFMATCLSLETYKAWGELKKKYTEVGE